MAVLGLPVQADLQDFRHLRAHRRRIRLRFSPLPIRATERGLARAERDIPRGRERILLADDEATIIHSEARLLELLGYASYKATLLLAWIDCQNRATSSVAEAGGGVHCMAQPLRRDPK